MVRLYEINDPSYDLTNSRESGGGHPSLHRGGHYIISMGVNSKDDWGPDHQADSPSMRGRIDDKHPVDTRFHGKKHFFEWGHEWEEGDDGCKTCWENRVLEDAVEIARACLLEAGFVYMAAYVQQNRKGYPTYKGPIRTEEELRAITRAFRLAHMGDDRGKPIICCTGVPELILEQALASGGYIAACDHCTMHQGG